MSLAIMFLAGFLLSRLTKLVGFPNVTAYIVAGIIIGPLLGLVPGVGGNFIDANGIEHKVDIISNMSFISDVSLGFIAFGVGKFFKKNVIKNAGWKVLFITLFEALSAGILVTLVAILLFPKLGWSFAILLGAIATATAPASTMMTINQYDAKGSFVDTLLQVVALDDIVCLVVFSISLGVSNGLSSGHLSTWNDIVLPILLNGIFIIIGVLAGLLLSFLVKGRSSNSRLIIAVGLICVISGFGALLNVSPLLSCMMIGATYINFKKDEKLFKYVDHFIPPIMLLFFVRSGMTMEFKTFATVGLIGLVYFAVRIVGKYLGSYLSCLITNKEKNTKIYLGLALIPQAGVALGLAELGKRSISRTSLDTAGMFSSIIICSSILYELVGPVLAKLALVKSGSIDKEKLNNISDRHKDMLDNPAVYSKISVNKIEQIQRGIAELACGAVIYTKINGELKYLIIHSVNGDYGFPKGHMEQGETSFDTALREIKEEVGIDVRLDTNFVKRVEYPIPNGHQKIVDYFVAEYSNQEVVTQESEVVEYFLLPFEEAYNLLNHTASREILASANKYILKKE